VSYNGYEPLMLRPDDDGRIPFGRRVRAGFSRWFYQDRIVPPTQAEIEQSKHEGH